MSDANQELPIDQRATKERLAQLAAQLEAGFEELHCLKKKGLDLALHYGPLLLEWKELVGHGGWQKEVREKVKGADLRTCNRWKRIAQRKADVEDALARWPEVRWGVARMLAYLSGKFDPAHPEDSGDDEADPAPTAGAGQDRADAYGPEADAAVAEGAVVTDEDDRRGPHDKAIPTIRFPPAAQARPEAHGTTHPPSKGKAKRKDKTKLPTVSPTEVVEYEVEIVKVFKLMVPKDTTEESVRTAFENGAVRIQASAEGRPWAFSDEGRKGRLNHVRSWG